MPGLSLRLPLPLTLPLTLTLPLPLTAAPAPDRCRGRGRCRRLAAAAAPGLTRTVPASLAASTATQPVSTGNRAIFEPVAPVRVLDTRSAGQGPALEPRSERHVAIAGVHGLAADTLAIVVNATAVSPTRPGYLTVWPAGETRPTTSNVNFLAGQVVANLTT